MKTIVALILITLSIRTHAQSNIDFTVDHMQSATIYVLSCYKDTAAIGGFATSETKPLGVSSLNHFNQKGFFLLIDTTSEVTFKQKYKGFDFFIVNTSDSTIIFNASDSRLNIIAEAYVVNEWKRIEYLPLSFCENSYHKIFLMRDHYWKVPIPKYSGELHVMIRYKLQINGVDYCYSNSYWGGINKAQLIAPKKFEW